MAECGHCRDCKWWEQLQDEDSTRWGFCRRFERLDYGIDKQPGSLVQLWSVKRPERYAGMHTADIFGCIQWECKGG